MRAHAQARQSVAHVLGVSSNAAWALEAFGVAAPTLATPARSAKAEPSPAARARAKRPPLPPSAAAAARGAKAGEAATIDSAEAAAPTAAVEPPAPSPSEAALRDELAAAVRSSERLRGLLSAAREQLGMATEMIEEQEADKVRERARVGARAARACAAPCRPSRRA
jgi:hypothetical protein